MHNKQEEENFTATPKYLKKTDRISKKEGKLVAIKNKSMLKWVSKNPMAGIRNEPSNRLEEEEGNIDWQYNEVEIMNELDKKARLAEAGTKKLRIINNRMVKDLTW